MTACEAADIAVVKNALAGRSRPASRPARTRGPTTRHDHRPIFEPIPRSRSSSLATSFSNPPQRDNQDESGVAVALGPPAQT